MNDDLVGRALIIATSLVLLTVFMPSVDKAYIFRLLSVNDFDLDPVNVRLIGAILTGAASAPPVGPELGALDVIAVDIGQEVISLGPVAVMA